jgi:hypothetical protein
LRGTSASIPLADMASLIPSPPVLGDVISTSSTDNNSSLLPPFLQIGSHITSEHDGEYRKGLPVHNTSGTYRFSFKTHFKKKSEDWGWTFPTCLSLGLTYAHRVFCSQAMLPIHLSVHRQTLLHPFSPLTLW